MKNFIEARGEHKPSQLLQAVTPEGESEGVKKMRTLPHIYKCRSCGTERRVEDRAYAPKTCSYCGEKKIDYIRTE
jgi:rubrerythrin